MRLSEWFKLDSSPDQRTFAELVGVHPISISKYANGRMVPRPLVADRIQVVTDGNVTPSDFARAFVERHRAHQPSQPAAT